jgi:DNA-binding NtrC family response regulator
MPLQVQPDNPAVLIAIDSRDRSRTVETYLECESVRCCCASDVAELYAVLERERPVLAVLDLDFAGGCMLEFCLTHSTLLSEVPVVYCATDGARAFDRSLQAVRHGARDVILGPLHAENLAKIRSELFSALRRNHEREPEALATAAPANDQQGNVLEPTDANGDSSHRRNAHCSESTSSIQAELALHLRGNSPAIRAIRRVIEDVAEMKATVLVHGESGTGKELVATAIHRLSDRRDRAFVPVNMSTIPQGLAESTLFGHEKGSFTSAHGTQIGWCEAADGGTLFLDEIGEMELSIQPKLLRFLQESTIQRVGAAASKKVDVRVIAATNRDLRELVAERTMREDLYFRLHVVPIHIPPLRERIEDIEPLTSLFMERCRQRYNRDAEGFTDEAMEILQRYSWPGNVRQLENIVERTVIFSRRRLIDARELPSEVHLEACFSAPARPVLAGVGMAAPPAGASASPTGRLDSSIAGPLLPQQPLSPMQRHERNAIVEALHRVDGHVIDAANLLGVGQATVYRKIKQYRIPHQRRRKRTPK